MSNRAEGKIAKALDVAERLEANGKSGWALIVRDVCRQNSAYRTTCRQLYNDNMALRTAQVDRNPEGHDPAEAVQPEGREPGPKDAPRPHLKDSINDRG
jgi:thioesterase domain-containing protein